MWSRRSLVGSFSISCGSLDLGSGIGWMMKVMDIAVAAVEDRERTIAMLRPTSMVCVGLESSMLLMKSWSDTYNTHTVARSSCWQR